jgi:hypothetical protein
LLLLPTYIQCGRLTLSSCPLCPQPYNQAAVKCVQPALPTIIPTAHLLTLLILAPPRDKERYEGEKAEYEKSHPPAPKGRKAKAAPAEEVSDDEDESD